MAEDGATFPWLGAVEARCAAEWQELATAGADRAVNWIARVRALREAAAGDGVVAATAAQRMDVLGTMRRDPESFEFTKRLIEIVAGTDDAFASATGLRDAAHTVPASMSRRDRLAVRAGGATSLGLPWAIMPVARKWLRDRVSHLVLATKLPSGGEPGRLTGLSEVLRLCTDAGMKPVLRPLGDTVFGPHGAAAELERLTSLASHPLVHHLVVDLERLVPGGSDWSTDGDAERAAQALRPLFEASVTHDTTIQVVPSSVRWARLLPEVMIRGLADPALDRARVGIMVCAELPEARELYDQFSRWAARRVAEGGAPAEVVIGVAGLVWPERIASIESGLAVPVLEDRTEVRAQLLRLCELAVHPGRAATLRPVIASEDLGVLGIVAELTERAETAALCSVQVRSGVVPGLEQALSSSFTDRRILLPVIQPKSFAGAVDLLIGYAAEAADPDSDISRCDELLQAPDGPTELHAAADSTDSAATADSAATVTPWETERAALAAAAALVTGPLPTPHRTQLRAREWDPSERDSALFYRAPDEAARRDTGGLTAAVLGLSRGSTGTIELASTVSPRAIPIVSASGFAAEPGTDASVQANREWVRSLLRRAADSVDADEAANDTIALSPADLDPAFAAQEARTAGQHWVDLAHQGRASRLRRAGLAVVAARDRLLQTLALETGAPAPELDREIDRIIDAARYSGQLAEGLAAVRGANFVSAHLMLVAADNWTSLSIQAESVLSVLAAGAGVLWAVPQRLRASAAVLLEEWEAGGVTPGAVRLEAVAMGQTLTELAARRDIDRAIVLGDRAAARDLAKRRPDLHVEGRFHGHGSIIIAPSADIDRAIVDVVASAFSEAGSDHQAAHALILVGSVTRSKRLRDGLLDAVRALRTGDTAAPEGHDPLEFSVGPLPSEPDHATLRALTELARGEVWLLQPQPLDESGRLWSPGIRAGVAPDATFWEDARTAPVLGIMHAHTLGEAIRLQNSRGSGVAAGLQSYDEEDIATWLELAEAASLALNRPTTGARTERRPFGAWNDAVMGLPAMSGGPNRLIPLGSWRPRQGTRSETLHLRGLDPEVQLLIEAAQPVLSYDDFDGVRRAALADALVWRTSFGVTHDTVGMGVERNLMRYWPVRTHVRLAEGGPFAALVRVIAAALLVRAPITISSGEVLPPEVSTLLQRYGIEISLERDDDWVARLAVSGPVDADGELAARVRLIGGDAVRTAEWMGGLDRTALWAEPVTMAGPVELLTLLREQSISARANRHGLAAPVPVLDDDAED